MKSCMGHILEVDLSDGTIVKKKVPDQVYDQVLSGKGLGAWYLYKNIPVGADPLGADNIIGFVSGALTGTGAFMCGRWMVVTKSPLTDGWGDANCGGNFSPAIKQCGVDAIFFKGISEKPVYFYMDNEVCELRDAADYWGLDAVETEKKLLAAHSGKRKAAAAVIGTAGENLSLISGICNEGGRIAARSGVGAVMGSKRLKAVVLAGSNKIGCADKQKVKELNKELASKIKKAYPPGIMKGSIYGFLGGVLGALPLSIPLAGPSNVGPLSKWGTSVNTVLAVRMGDTPIKNWGGVPKEIADLAKNFNPDHVLARETKKYHCYSCPLGCGGVVNISDIYNGEFEHTHKPEYETIACFGPLLLNNKLDSIYYINELLNRAGMDSISAGNTVAYAIECFENGLINIEESGGLELKWGNDQDIIQLIKQMIAREGIGDKLADGVKKAVDYFGAETAKYAMHVGGQEPGMHDTRFDTQLAVHYMTEPAPGKHTIGSAAMYGNMALWDICSWAPRAKPHLKKADHIPNEAIGIASCATACYSMVVDGAGGCYYGQLMGVNMWKLIEYINAGTGWELNGDEYLLIGKRIQTLRHMFNIKHGINPADRHLPRRMQGDPPLKSGPLNKFTTLADAQSKFHWHAMGYDPETGVPTDTTIESLNILPLLELDMQPA